MFQNTRTTGFFFALSQSISFIYKQKAFYRPKNLWYTYLSGPDEISSEVNSQIALQNRKQLWFCRLCFAQWLELPSLFSGEKCVSVISSFFYCKNEREREREIEKTKLKKSYRVWLGYCRSYWIHLKRSIENLIEPLVYKKITMRCCF